MAKKKAEGSTPAEAKPKQEKKPKDTRPFHEKHPGLHSAMVGLSTGLYWLLIGCWFKPLDLFVEKVLQPLINWADQTKDWMGWKGFLAVIGYCFAVIGGIIYTVVFMAAKARLATNEARWEHFYPTFFVLIAAVLILIPLRLLLLIHGRTPAPALAAAAPSDAAAPEGTPTA